MDEGTFPAVVTEGLLGMTSTGKEQVAVSVELTNEEGGPTGERIAWYGTFTDAAYPYTLKALRTMGWKGDDISDLSMMPGTQVSVVLENDSYNGKTRLKVKFVNPPGGGAILKEQMDANAAKSFAARMKAKVKAFDIAEGKPRATGKPTSRNAPLSPEPPPITESDEESLPDF